MNHPNVGLSEPMPEAIEQDSLEAEITDPEILAGIAALPTEDDLPYDDGEPMETPRHRDQMLLLIESLKVQWAHRRDYYVSGNMFLHYDPTNKRRSRGPDFFLVLDVDQRERKSWVVWYEHMRFPDLIIELLSDSTREMDLNEKKQLYERLFRTPEYYVYDPFSQEFLGYRLQGGVYLEVRPNRARRIFSAVTGLYLGIRGDWLRWITPEGQVVPTPAEVAVQETQRAEQERQRAARARQRAEQERQRATEAEQRATEAEQRATEAEQLLAAYRRRFGELT